MTFSNIKRMLDYFVHEQALLYSRLWAIICHLLLSCLVCDSSSRASEWAPGPGLSSGSLLLTWPSSNLSAVSKQVFL